MNAKSFLLIALVVVLTFMLSMYLSGQLGMSRQASIIVSGGVGAFFSFLIYSRQKRK